MTDLTIVGLAGTNVVLKKINQDAYSGEYFKRDSNTEYRVKVRHSNETVKATAVPMVRHNVDIMVTVFDPAGGLPKVTQAYMVMRHPLGGNDAQTLAIAGNLNLFLASQDLTRLIGWDTDLVATEA